MNETYVTLQGWVGNELESREVGETPFVSFRVGSTPRFYRNGEWSNGETQWYTINCWRSLARNVRESVSKGDAVVVHGKVRVDVWQREDGQPPSVSWIVDANFVGHDLSKGTSSFVKAQRAAGDPSDDESVRRTVHSYDAGGPQLNAQGEEVEPAA